MEKTLYLPLKKEWYEMIESGVKTEEYREIKPYWDKRLMRDKWNFCTDSLCHIPQKFDAVKFSYGYTDRTMTFKCDGITVGRGNKEWGAPDNDVFIIRLGDRVEEHHSPLAQLIRVAESLDWSVSVDDYDIELAQGTTRGQDFSFSIRRNDDYVQSVYEYYHDYDPSAEAMLWVDDCGHGKRGAPYELKDIIADMEEVEEMLKTLYEALYDAWYKED